MQGAAADSGGGSAPRHGRLWCKVPGRRSTAQARQRTDGVIDDGGQRRHRPGLLEPLEAAGVGIVPGNNAVAEQRTAGVEERRHRTRVPRVSHREDAQLAALLQRRQHLKRTGPQLGEAVAVIVHGGVPVCLCSFSARADCSGGGGISGCAVTDALARGCSIGLRRSVRRCARTVAWV